MFKKKNEIIQDSNHKFFFETLNPYPNAQNNPNPPNFHNVLTSFNQQFLSIRM
jgi:hypothetical protein